MSCCDSTIIQLAGGAGVNIYNADGALTGLRTVNGAGNNIIFNVPDFIINGKLTVSGMIDPIGLQFTQSNTTAVGATGAGKGTIYVSDSTDGEILNHPIYKDATGALFDLLAGTGDILQNGNSFGTDVVIGANDAFGLQLETGGLTRATIDAAGLIRLGNTGGYTNTAGIDFNTGMSMREVGVNNADYTVGINDSVIYVRTGAVDRTITLPPVSTDARRVVMVKKEDSGVGRVLFAGTGTPVDGVPGVTLDTQDDAVIMHGSQILGSGWRVLGQKIVSAAFLDNIYNIDGTLTSNRTLTRGAFPLTFTGTNGTDTSTSIWSAGQQAHRAFNNATPTTYTELLLNRNSGSVFGYYGGATNIIEELSFDGNGGRLTVDTGSTTSTTFFDAGSMSTLSSNAGGSFNFGSALAGNQGIVTIDSSGTVFPTIGIDGDYGDPGECITSTGSTAAALWAAPGLLSTVAGISLTATGVTNLYTVPATKTLINAKIVLLVTTATAVTVAPVVGAGSNGTQDDVFTPVTLIGLNAVPKYYQFNTVGVATGVAAAGVLSLGVDTAATATALTVTAYTFGQLV